MAFSHDCHGSRKSIIENIMLVGIGGHNGGHMSAISTQDVGKGTEKEAETRGHGFKWRIRSGLIGGSGKGSFCSCSH